MESFNIFKGYGRVYPSEDPSTDSYPNTKTSHKRRIKIAVLSIVFLTLIIGALVCVLIRESNEDDEEEAAENGSYYANSAESIRTVCSVTQYPDSCFSSISSISKSCSSKPDPESVFRFSLRVCIGELTNVSSVPKRLISKSNDPRSESALKECASLFDDSLSQLNQSLAAVEVANTGEAVVLTEAKIADLKTWISAAMTDQQTCLDGLEEMGSTALDEVKAKVQKSDQYMSNSLAILSNMPSLLDKFGLTMH